MTASVVVRRVDAHASAGDSVLAKGHTRSNRLFFKRPIAAIQVKLVGLRIIGKKNIRQTVAVVIKDRDAQTLRRRVVQPSFLGGVFKFAVAQVVPKPRRSALVRLRRAIGLMRAIQRAAQVARDGPLHIVGYDQIELSVAVVVYPRRTG